MLCDKPDYWERPRASLMEVSWVGLTLKEQLIWMDGTIHSAVFTRKRGRRRRQVVFVRRVYSSRRN